MVGLAWNVLPPTPPPTPPDPHASYSSTSTAPGKWPATILDAPPLLHAQRTAVAADHHAALAQHPPTLRQALETAPSLWTPAPSPLPAPVLVHRDDAALSLRDSVILGWLLRRCRSWQLSTSATPCIPLPPAAPPQSSLAWVVNALGVSPQDAARMAAPAPEDSSLVILARACDLPYIQARLMETLVPLALLDGLSVGRGIGAPLDMHDWPEE